MPVIEVRDLRKRYGEIEAVRSVSFEVGEGEVFCLLGPNGAGKSTTVEILEGYRARSAGSVSVLGHDPARGERSLFERVGIVLQESGVQSNLSVAEVLEMYGRYYPRRRGASELVKLVELDERLDTRVTALSGGQRRRLDLALALVGDPDILFLDEPTTGFDPSARRQAWSTLRELCALGKTVFLTTHFMDEAQTLADRVAVMVDGEIVAAGSPAEIGGRGEAPAEIRFRLPGDVGAADLPGLGGKTAIAGHDVLVVTRDASADAHRLGAWALERGVELRGFSVTQPTLEDIYLRLTESAKEEVVR